MTRGDKVMVWVVVVAFVLFSVVMAAASFSDGYESGQIDAQRGYVAWHLKQNGRGEKVWVQEKP